MPAFQQRCERGDDIGGEKCEAPPLPLTDVDELVGENALVDVIDAQHDVTEGDGTVSKAEPVRPIGPLADDYSPNDPSTTEERR
jgi:hypothetical protein